MTQTFEQELRDLTQRANTVKDKSVEISKRQIPKDPPDCLAETEELSQLIRESSAVESRVVDLYRLPLAPRTLKTLKEMQLQVFNAEVNFRSRIDRLKRNMPKEETES